MCIRDSISNVLRAEAELLKQFNRRTGVAELVVDADTGHRHRTFVTYSAAHSLAQAANDIMLLSSDDPACFLRGCLLYTSRCV